MAIAQECTAASAAQSNIGEDPSPVERAAWRRYLLPRSDGPRYRQLTLALSSGGELTLTSHEMGVSLEAAWGDDDHEVTLSLPAGTLARLAFILLSEQLKDRNDGLEHLLMICERHGVAHQLACWT